MPVFVRYLTCFLIIQGCIWAGAHTLYRKDKAEEFVGGYLTASIDKHHLLVQQPSPRIVFVGGSNLAFGLNSSEIERSLGYHPINMGLHIGLGLDFMLNEVEPFLKPNDVVVLSPEYEEFVDKYYSGNAETLFEEIEVQPRSIQFFTLRNLAVLLDQGFIIIGNITRLSISSLSMHLLGEKVRSNLMARQDNPYRRSAFNQFGDVTAHEGLAPRDFSVAQIAPPTPDSIHRAINRLNTFSKHCQQKGVLVFYSYPPLFQGQMQENAHMIHEIASSLGYQLTFPLLDTPEELSFPLDHLFDSYNHLNIVGKQIRTGHLIERLRNRLPGEHSVSLTSHR